MHCDFLVVGAGVVGLSIALELRGRLPEARIVVLEKERRAGEHASGRNSGVIHAGFYYSGDSLKARLCAEGNRRLTAWCDEHDVPIRKCGKLVVARNDAELAGLDELLRRGRANGVPLETVDAQAAAEIEPRARIHERALWSPSTSAVDAGAVMAELERQARARRIDVLTDTAWRAARGDAGAETDTGPIDAGMLVNAAGLYADRVAHAYGCGERYAIVPFKGRYLYGTGLPLAVHIYPVPDLAMPFLGVHFTVTVAGESKIGPTAFVAPWRESYGDRGLTAGASAFEMAEIAANGLKLLTATDSVRRHAWREIPKLSRRRLRAHAAELVRQSCDLSGFTRWGRPGIRAQLFDRERGTLVMDFCYERGPHSLHILNAVSPAFTCAFSFAEHVVDECLGDVAGAPPESRASRPLPS